MGPQSTGGGQRRMFPVWVAASMALALGGCSGGGKVELPPPRPIIVTSGERLRADAVRMDSVYAWLQVENQTIEEDPSFFIEGVPAARESLPWQTLTINQKADSARYQYDRAHPDVTTSYNVYAHLHLMKRTGHLADWLPDHASDEGYALERAIVARMADTWLLGRAVFDAPAYAPLDELIYAKEAGYLDAFLFTARPNDFAQERAAWERDKPGEAEAYRSWFQRTFRREPPGLRTATGS